MKFDKCAGVIILAFLYYWLVTLVFVEMLMNLNELQDMLATMGGICTMLGYGFSLYLGWAILRKFIRSH